MNVIHSHFQLALHRHNISLAGHHKTVANFMSVAFVHNRCRYKYNHSVFCLYIFVIRYLLNPRLTGEVHMQQYKFLGILLGVAVRTKKPLDLHLAPSIWKLLAGMSLSPDDVEEYDVLYMSSLRGIRDIDEEGVTEQNFHEVTTNIHVP